MWSLWSMLQERGLWQTALPASHRERERESSHRNSLNERLRELVVVHPPKLRKLWEVPLRATCETILGGRRFTFSRLEVGPQHKKQKKCQVGGKQRGPIPKQRKNKSKRGANSGEDSEVKKISQLLPNEASARIDQLHGESTLTRSRGSAGMEALPKPCSSPPKGRYISEKPSQTKASRPRYLRKGRPKLKSTAIPLSPESQLQSKLCLADQWVQAIMKSQTY